MKGRRKVKTFKWSLKAQYEAQARTVLQGRSAAQGRFLTIALQIGKELEPVGRLAG
ncbi:hypothetical protein PSEUDT2PL_00021 [Stutzerimonas stutzeri]|nr:hypothetical protein PSEUDT2PL_00021 [Stutzerimonas stutzeri]